ncbi:MAG: TolC family protein [Desulfuromonadales bacterium]|nr:TolC family protein [Desulfuromonadales bacterium]
MTAPTEGGPQGGGSFALPATQNLAGLVGMSEVSMLANIDEQFVETMAENQLLPDEFARLLEETDLSAAIHAGRTFNRQSLAAMARSGQAKAQAEQALSLLRPSVTLRVAGGVERSEPGVETDKTTGELVPSDNHSRRDIALTLRLPIFNLPTYFDWRRRLLLEKAREENYRISDGDAYIATVEAYLSLVSSRLQTDLTRDYEVQLAELLSYIEKRAEAGAASISDMARVRARIEATLSSRLEQESVHTAARIEFVRLTNLVPQKIRLPELADIGGALLPTSFNEAVASAIELNPEIASLAAELEAAQVDQRAARSRFLPRLDAEYTDTHSLHAGGDTSSAGQRDRRAMLVLNWNLFSGGSDYHYLTERALRHKELLYRLDDQRRLVVKSLSVNYAALTTTRGRIASGYQELKSITTAAQAMSKRMLSGNQSLLDLLDVYDRMYQVRSRLVSLHILEMNAVAQLIRLTFGTPWATADDTAATGRDRTSYLNQRGQVFSAPPAKG